MLLKLPDFLRPTCTLLFLQPFFDPVMMMRSIGLLQIKFPTTASKCTFCGFPWVETSTAGRVYDLCVYYMTGAPEGSPKVVLCGFMFFYFFIFFLFFIFFIFFFFFFFFFLFFFFFYLFYFFF